MLYFDDPYCFSSGTRVAEDRIKRARKWFKETYPQCSFKAHASRKRDNIGGYHIHIEVPDVDMKQEVWRGVTMHFFGHAGFDGERESLLIEYLMGQPPHEMNDYQKEQLEYVKQAMEIIGLTPADANSWSNKIHKEKS